MVFHWSLSDIKSPQVHRTLLSILTVLNDAVVWMVSTHPPTTFSFSSLYNTFVTVLKAPITIGIIVSFMFHFFFQFHSKVQVFTLHFTFFHFHSLVSRDSKVHNLASSFLSFSLFPHFHISFSRWSFTGVWMTASLLKFLDSSQYSGRSQ